MILVADSGSTKCDWILADTNSQKEFSTMGFNPFFHSAGDLKKELLKSALANYSPQITDVFFYGAGCHNTSMQKIIKQGLSSIFNRASITVDHDLTAAVYATCGSAKGITCILGTGSNSCYYDGNTISEQVPALGYILGDEGSGSYFGKKLLSSFLYKKLPLPIEKELIKLKISKDTIFENVYRKPHANVYLASFTKLLSHHQENPFVESILNEGFNSFLDIHVICFQNYREVPVHFVGSIGYYFNNVLKKILDSREITLGIVTQRPIDNLLSYHLNNQ